MIRRRRRETPPASINVTSLLDITFVLLISFMVVAPAVRYNVDLELPKVSQSKSSEKKKPVVIQVTQPAGGPVYYVNGQPTGLDDVPGAIKAAPEYKDQPSVSLEADRSVEWENIARLITVLKNNGVDAVNIVTERGK